MKVCVVGCTGYLGSKISLILKKNGHEIIGICRKFPNSNKQFKKNFNKIIQSEITNKNFVSTIIKLNPDAIVYTVSLNHIDSEKNLANSININYLPLLRLCNALRKSKKIIKFIYFSTMQVYGNYSRIDKISEKTPKAINNIYALTHSLCEDTLIEMNKNTFIESTSIRLSNGYGAPVLKTCDCWWLVVNDFCMNSIKKNNINLNSDGSPLRDFIHIKDIASAINILLKTKKKLPQVLNLASGNTLSMLDIANKVKRTSKKLDINSTISIKNKIISNFDIQNNINKIKRQNKFKVSTTLLKNYNIKPKLNINTGIKNTLTEIIKIHE